MSLNARLEALATRMGEALRVKTNERLRVYRPEEFGAVGDGTTDDHLAFTGMVSAMTSGPVSSGIIELRNGANYLINGPVIFPTPVNVTMEGNGATITRTVAGVLFGNLSEAGAVGYGAGGRGLTLNNFSISGGYSVGVISAFNHVSDMTLKGVKWVGAIRGTHALDLQGCSNVLIEDCEFNGNVSGGSLQAEAIQLDVSTYGASSLKATEPASCFDGLPTVDITVRRNKFRRMTVGGVNHFMPVPIGSHNFAREDGTGYYQNITFTENECEGWVQHPEGLAYGWVHLHGARSVEITKNNFTYSAPVGDAQEQTVINNRPITKVVSIATAGSATPTEVISSVPYVAEDWNISGNSFKGFGEAPMPFGIILFRGLSNDSDSLTVPEANIEIAYNNCDGTPLSFVRMYGNASVTPAVKYSIHHNTAESNTTSDSNSVLMLWGTGSVESNTLSSTNSQGRGIQVFTGSAAILNNRVSGGSVCIDIRGGSEYSIQGNFVKNAAAGIEVGTTTGTFVTDSLVVGNVSINCSSRSLRLLGNTSGIIMYANRAVNSPIATTSSANNIVDSTANSSTLP